MTSTEPEPAGVSSLHDVELAALAATGERRAFGELARRHGATVRRLLRRLGCAPATADALARDAFVGAFEQIAEFRGEGTFSLWIRKSAARLYVRKTRRGRRPAPSGAAPSPQLPPAGTADLDAALELLAPLERLCLVLSFGAGFAPREIAELAGLPAEAVRTHVRGALERLRPHLDPSAAPDLSGGGRRG